MKAFLTGSRVYGKPRRNSDIDLVVFVSKADAAALGNLCDDDGDTSAYATVRFGRLNLLVITDPAKYAAWVEGTAKLKAQRPVTREQAIEVFKALGV
jgi:predicted nucleotidyltransferase